MTDTDTIKLLEECDSGTKMAVSAIDEIVEQVKDPNLLRLLEESKGQHEALGNDLHRLLIQAGAAEKDPAPVAKGMSWIKTNMKLAMDNSDSTVADLITDGCNMGIKSLQRYLNQYKGADRRSREICVDIISLEEQLCTDLRKYL
ncbi:hypothetical protein [Hespellia stercorisuis]|uniref:DUF2383 domain-containing protein n=1 Tax=Hespellia stercorisuis DSM 15480 TaxID=1121950 RepID=A0A1M6MTH2_9FIRM|nr:hypothetical protein [Hespellia stercorisuis]SHJ86818.1 hypothetical protein SAMN02745243_01588 [Hespellia stercorisuis DSM 15480]